MSKVNKARKVETRAKQENGKGKQVKDKRPLISKDQLESIQNVIKSSCSDKTKVSTLEEFYRDFRIPITDKLLLRQNEYLGTLKKQLATNYNTLVDVLDNIELLKCRPIFAEIKKLQQMITELKKSDDYKEWQDLVDERKEITQKLAEIEDVMKASAMKKGINPSLFTVKIPRSGKECRRLIEEVEPTFSGSTLSDKEKKRARNEKDVEDDNEEQKDHDDDQVEEDSNQEREKDEGAKETASPKKKMMKSKK
jgi:hypothetical protein